MKFKIEEKTKEETNNKINKVTAKKITFSQFVIDACNYALDNMEK